MIHLPEILLHPRAVCLCRPPSAHCRHLRPAMRMFHPRLPRAGGGSSSRRQFRPNLPRGTPMAAEGASVSPRPSNRLRLRPRAIRTEGTTASRDRPATRRINPRGRWLSRKATRMAGATTSTVSGNPRRGPKSCGRTRSHSAAPSALPCGRCRTPSTFRPSPLGPCRPAMWSRCRPLRATVVGRRRLHLNRFLALPGRASRRRCAEKDVEEKHPEISAKFLNSVDLEVGPRGAVATRGSHLENRRGSKWRGRAGLGASLEGCQ